MHLGTGGTTKHPQIIDEDEKPCDVAAVVRDYRGVPCIPGTAIKGVLRAWAESFFPGESRGIQRIFGDRDIDITDAEAGWAEFTTALVERPPQRDLRAIQGLCPVLATRSPHRNCEQRLHQPVHRRGPGEKTVLSGICS